MPDFGVFTETIAPATTFFNGLYAAIAVVGASVVAIFGVTLAWPFIMGWMGKARRAGNGKAGS